MQENVSSLHLTCGEVSKESFGHETFQTQGETQHFQTIVV